jgi:hypothetical protein
MTQPDSPLQTTPKPKQPTPPSGDTQTRPVQVEIRGQGDLRAQATWQITSLTDRARFKRAARTSGILLGIAFGTLFIPIVHYVAPLAFLIGAVITFFVRMGTNELLAGEVPCPKCQKTFELESQPPAWPLDLTCHSCRAQLTATPLQSPTK